MKMARGTLRASFWLLAFLFLWHHPTNNTMKQQQLNSASMRFWSWSCRLPCVYDMHLRNESKRWIELSSWHFVSCVSINRTELRFPRRYLQHLTCNESPFTVLFVLNFSTTLRLSFIFLSIEFDFWFRVWHSPIILWKCTPQSMIVGYIFYYNSRWTWWLSSPHQRTLDFFEW